MVSQGRTLSCKMVKWPFPSEQNLQPDVISRLLPGGAPGMHGEQINLYIYRLLDECCKKITVCKINSGNTEAFKIHCLLETGCIIYFFQNLKILCNNLQQNEIPNMPKQQFFRLCHYSGWVLVGGSKLGFNIPPTTRS